MSPTLLGPDMMRRAARPQYDRGHDPLKYVARRVHDEHNLVVTDASLNAGAQAVIGAYTVPVGMYFIWKWLIQVYIGAATWIPGDGNIIWQIDVDEPLGATPRQGYLVNGWQASKLPYGGYNSGLYAPWELEEPEFLEPNSVLRSKAKIVNAVISAGQLVTVFGGSLWPRDQS
jgi:hypothetical protein